MLIVNATVNNNKPLAYTMQIVRGDAHPKLRHSFYYHYQADDDNKHRYIGNVVHNYKHGAFALTQKVAKAIVAQQKAAKA